MGKKPRGEMSFIVIQDIEEISLGDHICCNHQKTSEEDLLGILIW